MRQLRQQARAFNATTRWEERAGDASPECWISTGLSRKSVDVIVAAALRCGARRDGGWRPAGGGR
jgi:hypothetical protein